MYLLGMSVGDVKSQRITVKQQFFVIEFQVHRSMLFLGTAVPVLGTNHHHVFFLSY
jgi:hypothetical protein